MTETSASNLLVISSVFFSLVSFFSLYYITLLNFLKIFCEILHFTDVLVQVPLSFNYSDIYAYNQTLLSCLNAPFTEPRISVPLCIK